MKNLIQPFLDKFIAARKTADPTDDVQATQDLQKSIIDGNAELAHFYNTVLVPTSKQLGVFGEDAQKPEKALGGDAANDLGVNRVQLTGSTPAMTLESSATGARAAMVQLEAAQLQMTAAQFNAQNPHRVIVEQPRAVGQIGRIVHDAVGSLRGYEGR